MWVNSIGSDNARWVKESGRVGEDSPRWQSSGLPKGYHAKNNRVDVHRPGWRRVQWVCPDYFSSVLLGRTILSCGLYRLRKNDVDKRQHPRISCRIQCRLRIAQKDVAAVVRNVSEGGLSVYAEVEPPEQGEVAYLTLQPGRGPEIEMETLVWHVERRCIVSTGKATTQLGLVLASESEPFFDFLRSLRKKTSAPRARESGPDAPLRVQPVKLAPPPEPEEVSVAEPEVALEVESAPIHQYAIRVKQNGGPRSCNVVVGGESVEDAKEKALAEIGAGWTVLKIKML